MLTTTMRSLRRAPGLAIAAVLCLSLGAAATTAVSTLVGAVLLRPVPFPDAERLVRVWFDEPDVGHARLALDSGNRRLRAGAGVRSDSSAPHASAPSRSSSTAPSGCAAKRCRRSYFELLGLRPLQRSAPRRRDHRPGAPPVVVLSHGAWMRHFGSDPRRHRPRAPDRACRLHHRRDRPTGLRRHGRRRHRRVLRRARALRAAALKTDRMSRRPGRSRGSDRGRSMADADAQAHRSGEARARASGDLRPLRRGSSQWARAGANRCAAEAASCSLASAALLVIAAINVGCLCSPASSIAAASWRFVRRSAPSSRRLDAAALYRSRAARDRRRRAPARRRSVAPRRRSWRSALGRAAPTTCSSTPDGLDGRRTIGTLAVAGLLAGTVPALSAATCSRATSCARAARHAGPDLRAPLDDDPDRGVKRR